jgi:hypothetical protein
VTYRDRASFGRRFEFTVFAELLRRGFGVYQTLVDDQGIDCVVRLDETRYVDVQIKARSRDAEQPFLFAAMTVEPRENLFFVFYTEANDTLWGIPSKDVVGLGSTNVSGKNEGKLSLSPPGSRPTDRTERFSKYRGEHGFELLRRFKKNTAV